MICRNNECDVRLEELPTTEIEWNKSSKEDWPDGTPISQTGKYVIPVGFNNFSVTYSFNRIVNLSKFDILVDNIDNIKNFSLTVVHYDNTNKTIFNYNKDDEDKDEFISEEEPNNYIKNLEVRSIKKLTINFVKTDSSLEFDHIKLSGYDVGKNINPENTNVDFDADYCREFQKFMKRKYNTNNCTADNPEIFSNLREKCPIACNQVEGCSGNNPHCKKDLPITGYKYLDRESMSKQLQNANCADILTLNPYACDPRRYTIINGEKVYGDVRTKCPVTCNVEGSCVYETSNTTLDSTKKYDLIPPGGDTSTWIPECIRDCIGDAYDNYNKTSREDKDVDKLIEEICSCNKDNCNFLDRSKVDKLCRWLNYRINVNSGCGKPCTENYNCTDKNYPICLFNKCVNEVDSKNYEDLDIKFAYDKNIIPTKSEFQRMCWSKCIGGSQCMKNKDESSCHNDNCYWLNSEPIHEKEKNKYKQTGYYSATGELIK